MNIQLSIVIPVYKVKPYIRMCLERVLSIKDIQLEIILVQDINNDDSLEDVKDLLRDTRLFVLNQANAGLSAARNAGMKVAHGDYIYFLDSDDYLDPKAFSYLFNCYATESPEMIIGSFLYIDGEGKLLESRNRKMFPFVSGKFIGKEYLFKYFSYTMVWMNIFKLDFLRKKNLSFIEGIYYEDNEFMPRALYLAKQVCVTDKPFYYYRIRPESLSQHTRGIRQLNSSIIVTHSLISFCNKTVTETTIRNHIETSVLALFLGTLGFYLQDNVISEDIRQNVSSILNKLSINRKWNLRLWMIIVIGKISLPLMCKVLKQRYKHKYFKS